MYCRIHTDQCTRSLQCYCLNVRDSVQRLLTMVCVEPRAESVCLVTQPRESLDLTPTPKPFTTRGGEQSVPSRGEAKEETATGRAVLCVTSYRKTHVLARGDKVDPKTLAVNKGQLITSQPGDRHHHISAAFVAAIAHFIHLQNVLKPHNPLNSQRSR